MTAKRAFASLIAAMAMLVALVMPAAAGIPVACSLQATVGGGSATIVTVGEEVLIEGFDFTPDVDVDVQYSVDATPMPFFTVTADATGAFETTVTPQPGEEGTWTVEAQSVNKGGCSANTGFEVVAAPPTPTPTPVPPTPTPTPTPTAPPTGGLLPDAATPSPSSSAPLWILGIAVFAVSAVMTVREAVKRRRA